MHVAREGRQPRNKASNRRDGRVKCERSPLVRAMVPKKLVSIRLRSTARSVSRAAPRELMPALFTRISTRPNTCRASRALSGREEGEERSRASVLGE